MITCKLLCLVLVFMFFGAIPYVTAEDYIQILDNYKTKDSVNKLFDISGKTSYSYANMTVTYPDKSTVTSSIAVTNNGYFQAFIVLHPTDPAGLYMVAVNPYNSTVTSSTLNTSFFMPD